MIDQFARHDCCGESVVPVKKWDFFNGSDRRSVQKLGFSRATYSGCDGWAQSESDWAVVTVGLKVNWIGRL
jgi:hypothetical protein